MVDKIKMEILLCMFKGIDKKGGTEVVCVFWGFGDKGWGIVLVGKSRWDLELEVRFLIFVVLFNLFVK